MDLQTEKMLEDSGIVKYVYKENDNNNNWCILYLDNDGTVYFLTIGNSFSNDTNNALLFNDKESAESYYNVLTNAIIKKNSYSGLVKRPFPPIGKLF